MAQVEAAAGAHEGGPDRMMVATTAMVKSR
jgi:hypothetical protein